MIAVSNVDHEGTARISSFADTAGLLLHASPEDSCSPGLREILIESWAKVKNKIAEIYSDSPDLSVGFHEHGTYFNVDGPHFRDPATEYRLRNTVYDAAVIGQTVFPENMLAREMAMAYEPVGMCVDNSSFPGAKPVQHADGVMHAVVSTAQAALLLLNEAVRRLPENFYEVTAHDAMRHSLHPSQIDLNLLRKYKRTKLAIILEQELASRS